MTEQPTILADADVRADWLEQRRQGITATEVAKAATGRPADRRNIITEKIGGDVKDFDSKFYAWGRTREPFITEWIERNYGIAGNRHLMAHPHKPQYLATPDGYTLAFDGEAVVAEVKTSKHELDPGPCGIPMPGSTPTLTATLATDIIRGELTGEQFWNETYYDQIQWQMFVTGAQRALFVWETHDDAWPNPTPVGPPRAYWIARNDDRIAYLVTVADALLEDVERARTGSLPWDSGDVPEALVDPVHRLLVARNNEAVARTAREAVWKEVQELVKALDEDEAAYENHEAKVSWSTKYQDSDIEWDLSHATAAQRSAHEKRIARMDRAAERVERAKAALKRADESWEKAREAFEEKSARWKHVEQVPAGRRVTVTGKKQGDEK